MDSYESKEFQTAGEDSDQIAPMRKLICLRCVPVVRYISLVGADFKL